MRIVVIGAYGLLGGYVTARLLNDGHDVVGVGRDVAPAKRRFPEVVWVKADLRTTTQVAWAEILQSADVVVNCAGALQDGPRDRLQAVHADTVSMFTRASEASGVKRIVQISAVGVDEDRGAFARTKRDADAAVREGAVDWVILRPGLVLAPAAYGGSALLRGLAGFPFVIPAIAPNAPVQCVWADDVAEAVSRAVALDAPSRIVCDILADEQTSLGDVLTAMRAWLGFGAAPVVALPVWMGRRFARGADILAYLGWRSPMRTTSIDQLTAGVKGRGRDAEDLLGFRPRRLAEALGRWPSGVQERWFARLYFVKPLGLAALAAFWIVSGLIGFAAHGRAASLLTGAGMGPDASACFVTAGSVADVALGVLACFRRSAPLALVGMILVTCAYLIGATLWLPGLWGDPLGPLVKSVPAAILAMAVLALMDER